VYGAIGTIDCELARVHPVYLMNADCAPDVEADIRHFSSAGKQMLTLLCHRWRNWKEGRVDIDTVYVSLHALAVLINTTARSCFVRSNRLSSLRKNSDF